MSTATRHTCRLSRGLPHRLRGRPICLGRTAALVGRATLGRQVVARARYSLPVMYQLLVSIPAAFPYTYFSCAWLASQDGYLYPPLVPVGIVLLFVLFWLGIAGGVMMCHRVYEKGDHVCSAILACQPWQLRGSIHE
jgi:hypothetical protein